MTSNKTMLCKIWKKTVPAKGDSTESCWSTCQLDYIWQAEQTVARNDWCGYMVEKQLAKKISTQHAAPWVESILFYLSFSMFQSTNSKSLHNQMCDKIPQKQF